MPMQEEFQTQSEHGIFQYNNVEACWSYGSSPRQYSFEPCCASSAGFACKLPEDLDIFRGPLGTLGDFWEPLGTFGDLWKLGMTFTEYDTTC